MIRVAVFEPFGNLYGSERSLMELLLNIPKDRALPIVYCPRDAPWLDSLQAGCIRTVVWFERDLHLKGQASRLHAFVKFMVFLLANRIDLIHVNQAGALPYALAASKLLRLPVVFHSRWHEDGDFLKVKKINKKSGLSAIVGISDFQFSSLKETGPNRVVVVRNPYTLRLQKVSTAVRQCPYFICPARLHPHKRQDLLVYAVQKYIERYGDCSLEFIGEEIQGTGFLSHLKQLAVRLGVDDKCKFNGYDKDWMERASAASAVLLSSDIEALGRVIFEAWDAGTIPVAWKNSGGPSETIGLAGAGILYESQDPHDIAEAMHQTVCLSQTARAALIERGQQWVQNNCSVRAHVEKILFLWESLVPRQ